MLAGQARLSHRHGRKDLAPEKMRAAKMQIHQLSVQEALASLQSRWDGLTSTEGARRLGEYGRNEVVRARQEPAALKLVKEFGHFFAIILWIAAALAFFAEYRDPGEGMATLGLAIVGVILVNGLFSFWQAYRAEQAIEALKRLLPNAVKLIRDGRLQQAPAEILVPGDVILLEGGDNVPADCRVLEAFGVRVNNATITGESIPRSLDAEPCGQSADFLASRNVLLAGTALVSGQAKALVFATGGQTAFGDIARLTQAARRPLSPLQKEIVRLSWMVAIMALVPGISFFFIGTAIGLSFWQNLTFAIGIIVALVPEGLLPEVTLALAMGVKRMARRNALIRHLPAVETLGSTTVICTDKTGTLTENRMVAQQIFMNGHFYDPAAPELAGMYRPFFECALLCEDVKHGADGELLGDPMEVALVGMAQARLKEGADLSRVDEIPFDSNRKRLSVLFRAPEGLILYTKGAPEKVLARCRQIAQEDGFELITQECKETLSRAQETMAASGMRVLALAHRQVPGACPRDQWEEDLVFDGLVGFADPPGQRFQTPFGDAGKPGSE
jgi:sodium/potassium-transporting ATPase subunit alpha